MAAEGALVGSWFLMAVGFVHIAAMAVLDRRYWFNAPFRGISLAAILCVAVVVSAAA